ncbi:grasp-with-spasm system ATP-grasp peptide maturase [Chryseobacterium pennipullorum]|uniref:Grasp-with-spasm system ATP-grasp peptide maturase n=1 Tax=Chryseobacterium pennipullorum TaxID=2258963 RepID=A0A3D9AY50_9FLAO|nr:grasp-with-spasm system ATP-grasp peptide maturase [Chryseobacterium pennipullorum]REC46251.1 grasp-with-spasm system ATP-grasp peptide maturase [Chryseobacterium pennipullorum]
MILILSTPNDDDTNLVMEHLAILGEKCIRINDLDLFNGNTKMHYELSPEPTLIVENSFFGKIDLADVNCVWYRKFGFFDKFKKNFRGETNVEMLEYLKLEYTTTLDLFFDFLKNKKWLNNQLNIKKLNKISTLIASQQVGLTIPKTNITNTADSLNRNESYITKSIKDGSVIDVGENTYFFLTKEVNPKTMAQYSHFFPSLFQEKVDKEYELRIFHLNGKNYPMAIFSQRDTQTGVDYRHYNYSKPNRMIPYTLPEEVDRKISLLMKNIGLDTGSLDIIKGKDGEYYFLEVNPSGQFRMTALPCNYNLHHEVAHCLQKMNT